MLAKWYAEKMWAWETALTTRDTNRIVRPLEWGFEWLGEFGAEGLSLGVDGRGGEDAVPGAAASNSAARASAADFEASMTRANEAIVARSEEFFGYKTPSDFRLELRHPELFPTNVRPETLARDAELRAAAAAGMAEKAEFLRFTSAVKTQFPENDQVNARWYPANAAATRKRKAENSEEKRPRQAMIVMPQWNADAFSHNALCTLFNRFGISCLRLSKPYHDIRRPPELERSDYAVSANIGRTMAACRQAVADIRSCVDWLEQQGYDQVGVLGTSLGSCYAFIAAAHDARLRVCAFNHAATWFGDVLWTGQSTRHLRQAFEEAGLDQEAVRRLFLGVSPMAFMEKFAQNPKRVLVVHARYDLTFLPEFSEDVLVNFRKHDVDFVSKVLPCGHYTTGETPYQYIDGWYLGSFIYNSFKRLREQR